MDEFIATTYGPAWLRSCTQADRNPRRGVCRSIQQLPARTGTPGGNKTPANQVNCTSVSALVPGQWRGVGRRLALQGPLRPPG